MKTFEFKQGSAEWHAARRGIPTASLFDRILTPAKGQPSAQQDGLIDELIAEALIPPDNEPERMTHDMRIGMEREGEARDFYELSFAPGPVRQVGFVLHDSGLFGGSPDALVGEDGGLEVKAPSGPVHIGYVRGGVLPAAYRLQVHGYMAVTGRPWWSFFSFHRGLPPFHIRVEHDDFTCKLAVELLAFCKRYNEARAKFGLKPIGA